MSASNIAMRGLVFSPATGGISSGIYLQHGIKALTIEFSDTVHPSESKSRRWKSPNTPSTSAHSAERRPSRDIRWESGTARHATRRLLEEHTPYRTYYRNPRFLL